MFGFTCKHCGHLQIAHHSRETLIDYHSSNLWPDDEYQEDAPLDRWQDLAAFLKRKKGSRYALLGCPGFLYRFEEKQFIIDRFAEASLARPWITGYIGQWEEELQTRITELETEEEARMEERSRAMIGLDGGSTVYIVYDHRRGGTWIYFR